MNFRVRLTAEAVRNQNEIVDWIAGHSITGALAWLDELDAVLQQLSFDPTTFLKAPEDEFCEKELRNAPFGTRKGRRFRAIFYVDGNLVIVTHLRGPDQNVLTREDVADL